MLTCNIECNMGTIIGWLGTRLQLLATMRKLRENGENPKIRDITTIM